MQRTTFREMVHQAFQGAVDRAFPELPNQQAVVAPTGNPKIADYQCNNAMIISGRLPQPPKEKPAPAENGQVGNLPCLTGPAIIASHCFVCSTGCSMTWPCHTAMAAFCTDGCCPVSHYYDPLSVVVPYQVKVLWYVRFLKEPLSMPSSHDAHGRDLQGLWGRQCPLHSP